MAQNGKETERKYLIEYPDLDLLSSESFAIREITQTYLTSEGNEDRRVRRSVEGGYTVYTYTEKRPLSKLTRYEDEREISRAEYDSYLDSADPDFIPLHKTRFCIRVGGRIAEVDVYDGISDFAICEVELEDEGEEVVLPSCVSLIREVTGEKEYSNRYFCRRGR